MKKAKSNVQADAAADDGRQEPCHFLIIIPAYREDAVILPTARAALQQQYPQGHFTVAVVSDHQQEATNRALAKLPLTLLLPHFEKSSKARALQYAVAHTTSRYDYAVILDADNIVRPDFLCQLDTVCRHGHSAIQCHRTAKNSDGHVAMLDGLSEEINNTVFRRGHNRVGLSAALIGSGMCFSYDWFSKHVGGLQTAGEDRELEKMLLTESVHIHYAEHIHVMDEKVASSSGFQQQRLRWMSAQLQSLLALLPGCRAALLHGNIDYIDKTLQQALIPRSMLLVLLPVASAVVTLFSPPASVKWWCLTTVFCLSLLAALPKPMRNMRAFAALVKLPALVGLLLRNISHLDRHNRDFIHTQHT